MVIPYLGLAPSVSPRNQSIPRMTYDAWITKEAQRKENPGTGLRRPVQAITTGSTLASGIPSMEISNMERLDWGFLRGSARLHIVS